MVEHIMSAMPPYTDRAIVHRALEECKGNVDNAYWKLLDTESQSSCSSRSGSLSVERDADSEDESLLGPKKKQDRGLSRVKRVGLNEKGSQSDQLLSVPRKIPHIPPKHASFSASKSHHTTSLTEDAYETEEEHWVDGSLYKDSESASVSTSASDHSVSSGQRSNGPRLKLSQPKKREDKPAAPESVPARDLPFRSHPSQQSVKGPHQRLQGHGKRLYSKNQINMMKKATQKTAAKERRREAAAESLSNPRKGKENTPAIETHIKVLYI